LRKQLLGNATYISGASRLAEVIEILRAHYDEAKNFYLAASLGFQISKQATEVEKLRNLFVFANRERRGFSESSLGKAVSEFSANVDGKTLALKDNEPSEAHYDFLIWLCSIPHTGQKTANLFLKWVVMFAEELELKSLDWSSWRHYLHVPLDRWVLRMMGQNLKVGTPAFQKDFLNPHGIVPGIDIQGWRKYFQLQGELATIASIVNEPKIILDELWLVGHALDIYRPWLCDHCWIQEYCEWEGKR